MGHCVVFWWDSIFIGLMFISSEFLQVHRKSLQMGGKRKKTHRPKMGKKKTWKKVPPRSPVFWRCLAAHLLWGVPMPSVAQGYPALLRVYFFCRFGNIKTNQKTPKLGWCSVYMYTIYIFESPSGFCWVCTLFWERMLNKFGFGLSRFWNAKGDVLLLVNDLQAGGNLLRNSSTHDVISNRFDSTSEHSGVGYTKQLTTHKHCFLKFWPVTATQRVELVVFQHFWCLERLTSVTSPALRWLWWVPRSSRECCGRDPWESGAAAKLRSCEWMWVGYVWWNAIYYPNFKRFFLIPFINRAVIGWGFDPHKVLLLGR